MPTLNQLVCGSSPHRGTTLSPRFLRKSRGCQRQRRRWKRRQVIGREEAGEDEFRGYLRAIKGEMTLVLVEGDQPSMLVRKCREEAVFD